MAYEISSDKKILVAFLLNLSFSIFEFVGGVLTGSVAIASDAVHDMGDAVSIGCSYVLERKSKQQANTAYSYGYARYSIFGSILTTAILLFGSIIVIANSITRIINPVDIHYDGMIIFAVIGVIINFLAARFTHGGHSMNQKAVNLHMLEDVLGWIVVLVGAIIIRFTGFTLLDPLMSIGVATFILIEAWKTFIEAVNVLSERTPKDVNADELIDEIQHIDGVIDMHHLHIWSLDGVNHCATLHVVTDKAPHDIKHAVKHELAEHGIAHVTVEVETPQEACDEIQHVNNAAEHHHHHHHH